jgi:hypothetical protein
MTSDIAGTGTQVDGAVNERFVARWPVYAIVGFVGLFCVVVAVLWVRSHLVLREDLDVTAWIIALATVLRVVTIVIALASIQSWGSRLPKGLVATGLWGCAAAQLIYPIAELAVKLFILAGAVDLAPRGVGDMSATGWFNLSMVWLIFGVPGALFVLAARSHHNRVGGRTGPWPVIGLLGGGLMLMAIGFLIG